MANRLHRSHRLVSEPLDGIESPKIGLSALFPPFQGDQGSADSPGFAGIGVHNNLSFRDFRENEINLGFHDSKILMRSTLQDVLSAHLLEVV